MPTSLTPNSIIIAISKVQNCKDVPEITEASIRAFLGITVVYHILLQISIHVLRYVPYY